MSRGQWAISASAMARAVASASTSGGRVSAWKMGASLPCATYSLTSTSMMSPFSAWTQKRAPASRTRCMMRNRLESVCISGVPL